MATDDTPTRDELPAAPHAQRDGVAITEDSMTAVYGGKVVATATYREHAAADGGAWIVSTFPARLFAYNDAITALTIAKCVSAGYGDNDPFVKSWRVEIGVRA